ncbi:hypothetical protein CDAR_309331 [Caerostris darwini]|uniref:Uncharacterized protein n=1 Tax=Caerostris darwini TaxID=1538125 RepID=A0AAV4WPV1_9ARAC|nr:hypothetical protein CDAR_309331 [Caerostris darwini]
MKTNKKLFFRLSNKKKEQVFLAKKTFQATLTSSSIVTFSHVRVNQVVTSRRLPVVSSNPYNPLGEMNSPFKSVYRISHLETFHTYERGDGMSHLFSINFMLLLFLLEEQKHYSLS